MLHVPVWMIIVGVVTVSAILGPWLIGRMLR
jgi:hypothetical protein